MYFFAWSIYPSQSYEWGCQQSVMLIKGELQKAGYRTWMDIDKMVCVCARARMCVLHAIMRVCTAQPACHVRCQHVPDKSGCLST